MIWLTFCLLFVNYLYESQQDVWKDIILPIMLTSCYKDIILPIMLTRWMMLLKWFTICKRVVWMFVNNDMNLLRIWLALLIRLQTSCLIIVNTRENIFKQQISMLILLCGCLPLQRSLIVCLWYWSYRRRYISCKWFD